MTALLPYFAFILILLPLAYFYLRVGKWQRESFAIICFILFACFFGLHGEMGNDWHHYYSTYLCDGWVNVLDFIRIPFSTRMMEPGFVTMMMICRSIGLPFQGFIFVVALTTGLLLFRFLLHHEANIPLSLILFFCFGGIELEINYLRSAFALLIFLNAIPYIKGHQPTVFIALIVLCMSFHVSALLYLPCYYLYHRSIPVKWYAGIMLVGVLLYILQIRLATYGIYAIDRILGYNSPIKPFILAEEEYLPTIPLGAIERTLTALAIILNKDRIEAFSKWARLFVNSYLVYFVFAFYLWDIPIINDRFALIFIYVYWLLWPMLPRLIQTRWKQLCIVSAMSIYCGLRLLGIITNPLFAYQLF